MTGSVDIREFDLNFVVLEKDLLSLEEDFGGYSQMFVVRSFPGSTIGSAYPDLTWDEVIECWNREPGWRHDTKLQHGESCDDTTASIWADSQVDRKGHGGQGMSRSKPQALHRGFNCSLDCVRFNTVLSTSQKMVNLLRRLGSEYVVDPGHGTSIPKLTFGSIDTMIVLDRQLDMVTPMCTQLTYEGLLDEVFGIKHGQYTSH